MNYKFNYKTIDGEYYSFTKESYNPDKDLTDVLEQKVLKLTEPFWSYLVTDKIVYMWYETIK